MSSLLTPSRLAAVPFTAVTIDDQFWSPRLEINRQVTLPAQYRQCLETGRIDAFRLNWKAGDPNPPHIFWDSDVAKWIEAASYTLATHPDPDLEGLLDEVISLISSAQQPDGYLNTHFTVVEPDKRWSNWDHHELYCAGHLVEAAVAHFQATGKRTLLDTMCRSVDYISQVFGPNEGQRHGYCGHEEIELALVKLAGVTGEQRYLELSSFFVEGRGQLPHYFDLHPRWAGDPWKHEKDGVYNQSHLPVREQHQVVGHSVRAMYLYSAMADLSAQLDDSTLLEACERLWKHLTERNLYVTGGLGSTHTNEGFTFDYDLPNETAYGETCAAIGLVFWAHRMAQLTRNAQYVDVLERALYNGVISGVSLDGAKFFYENPLASLGRHRRQDWFGCACCPPNLARLLASLGEYIYAQGAAEVVVNLYVGGVAKLEVAGAALALTQKTRYPWDGQVNLELELDAPAKFALRLRVPGWCHGATVAVNGLPVHPPMDGGYFGIERHWESGDRVQLNLPMPVERVHAHPRERHDAGRVTLQRGPLVYCLEQVDNGELLQALVLPESAALNPKWDRSLLGGVIVLEGGAQRATEADWEGTLYRTEKPVLEEVPVRAVPYYAWENREAGEMVVWVREI